MDKDRVFSGADMQRRFQPWTLELLPPVAVIVVSHRSGRPIRFRQLRYLCITRCRGPLLAVLFAASSGLINCTPPQPLTLPIAIKLVEASRAWATHKNSCLAVH